MKGGLGAHFLITGLLLIASTNAQDDSLAGSFLSGKFICRISKVLNGIVLLFLNDVGTAPANYIQMEFRNSEKSIDYQKTKYRQWQKKQQQKQHNKIW